MGSAISKKRKQTEETNKSTTKANTSETQPTATTTSSTSTSDQIPAATTNSSNSIIPQSTTSTATAATNSIIADPSSTTAKTTTSSDQSSAASSSTNPTSNPSSEKMTSITAPVHDPTAQIHHHKEPSSSSATSPTHRTLKASTSQQANEKAAAEEDKVAPLPVEFPPGMSKPAGRQRRYSVSAESDRTTSVYVKKVIPKSEAQLKRIKAVTAKSILFSGLDSQQLTDIYDSMEEYKVVKGDEVIKQFDSGDYFYVIDYGTFDVFKSESSHSERKHVFTYKDTGSFGELALMYNCPRAATVIALNDGLLWRCDRETFRHLIIESTLKKRKVFEELIQSIPILSKLNKQERAQVVDCLETKEFKLDDVVLRQGEPGEDVYFIVEGQAKATQTLKNKDGSKNDKLVNVGQMTAGEYFGERALIKREPRAANVICASKTMQCAVMDRSAFERLLGDVKDIMARHAEEYKKAEDIETE